jgi:hypothetical protein
VASRSAAGSPAWPLRRDQIKGPFVVSARGLADPTVFIPCEYVNIAVEDNGEGRAAPPDRVTGIPENEPLQCDGGQLPSFNISDVLRGSVKVR